jgi:hypothetical protein
MRSLPLLILTTIPAVSLSSPSPSPPSNPPSSEDLDPIPLPIRQHWMRYTLSSLLDLTNTPCPHAAFGAAIVNHTAITWATEDRDATQQGMGMGKLVCVGVNSVRRDGNPVLHGEFVFSLRFVFFIGVVVRLWWVSEQGWEWKRAS